MGAVQNNAVRKLLKKDGKVDLFIKCAGKKISKEIGAVASNPLLKIHSEQLGPEKLSIFHLNKVHEEHKDSAPFTRLLLRCCVVVKDTLTTEIEGGDAEDLCEFRDSMDSEDLEFTDRINSTRNRVLVGVVALCMLCYARNDSSSLLQSVNGHLAFPSNVPKRCVGVFHQIRVNSAIYSSKRQSSGGQPRR